MPLTTAHPAGPQSLNYYPQKLRLLAPGIFRELQLKLPVPRAASSMANWAELKEALKQGKLLLPGDEDFEDSLKRWSSGAVKPAVSADDIMTDCLRID